MAPAQAAAEAKKDKKLPETQNAMQNAKPTGHEDEQDVPKAAATDQTVVNAERDAELSTKGGCPSN